MSSGTEESRPVEPFGETIRFAIEADGVKTAGEVAGEDGVPTHDAADARDEGLARTGGVVGVVFVHGIGSQPAGDTLLNWSAPIVRALAAWEDEHAGHLVKPWRDRKLELIDPVVTSQIDFDGATLPLIKIDVPGLQDASGRVTHHRQTWVMTEAWWASRLTPPSLSAVVDWTSRQGVLGRVVIAIVTHGGLGSRLAAIEKLGVGLFLSVLSSIVLLGVLALRGLAAAVPIGPLKDLAVLQQFESFMVSWWGDVHELMGNPVQSANVRDRVVRALRGLDAYGCDRIVIIAHSGGTVVSYMVLGDPSFQIDGPGAAKTAKVPRVTKLITHGNAINLVRDLRPGIFDSDGGDFVGAPSKSRNRVWSGLPWTGRWVDFWATHDPAPCGDLRPETAQKRVDSKEIWNRRSVRDDHGTYWENDEEFVLPLMRELDTPEGEPTESRFTAPLALPRNNRHERVHLLTLWRRVAFVAPFIAVVAALTAGPGTTGFTQLVDFSKALWPAVPGSDGISGGLNILHGILSAASLSAASGIGAGVLIALLVGLGVHAALPVSLWSTWDKHRFAHAAIVAVELLPLVVLGGLVIGFIRSVGNNELWLKAQDLVIPGAAAVVILGALVLRIATAPERPSKPSPTQALFATLATGGLVVAAVMVALSVLTDEPIRVAVVGAGLTFAVFRPLAGYGAMRWAHWDATERNAVRRGVSRPGRELAFIEAIALTGLAALAAWGIGWGPRHMPLIGDQNPLLLAAGLFLALALFLALLDALLVGPEGSASRRPASMR